MAGLEEAFNSGIILSGSVEVNEYKANNAKWANLALLFDYIQDETSTVEAEITDNWVESNWAYQDHIAIKPRVYRVRGCVGEVLYENISKALDKYDEFKAAHPVYQKTMSVLGGISMLSGTVSNYTQAAINIVKQIESSYDRYKQIFDNFTKASQIRGKRQAVLYEMLVYMMQQRVPIQITSFAFGVENFPELHPYNKLFFIQSVSARQGDSAFISDIELTIKEVRIAETKTTQVDKSKFGGFVASQKTEEANNGLSKGEKTDVQKPLAFVSETLGKATTISAAPKQTLGGTIKTFTLKMLEEAKIWVRKS